MSRNLAASIRARLKRRADATQQALSLNEIVAQLRSEFQKLIPLKDRASPAH